MNRISPEVEARLLRSVEMLVEHYVDLNLSPARRGIAATGLVRQQVGVLVKGALNSVAEQLVSLVESQIAPGEALALQPSGLLQVLNNTAPCSRCRLVVRVATLTMVEGRLTNVLCEPCKETPS